MTGIRLAISLFILVLIVLSIMGWVWFGTQQPGSQAEAGRFVLVLGPLVGVFGLVVVWRRPRGA